MNLSSLMAHVPVAATAAEKVVCRLQEPHRHYHNLAHVLEMWDWHVSYNDTRFKDLALQVIASFCLYHDAIYEPMRCDNEVRSAALWYTDAKSTAPSWVSRIVGEAILASADHFTARRTATTTDHCLDWCLNLDLLRLGVAEEQFTQYGRDIRAEYDHLSDLRWLKASAEFRSKVMAQPVIYQFAEFADYEQQARKNLAGALLHDWQKLGYLKPEPIVEALNEVP